LDPKHRHSQFQHEFVKLASGLQLHYLSCRSLFQSRHLVIFVHGFPDSCHIFSSYLSSAGLQSTNATLVSLDLPGCEGSDGLPGYGPDEVLNAIAEAIALLKARYCGKDANGNCILVGHDWGGIIASRLVAETCGLVDRVVMVNSVYVSVHLLLC
jgi:pimeloyl-ACP methyl ester carboxylesterase